MNDKTRVLVSGFKPFDEDTLNPSEVLVNNLLLYNFKDTTIVDGIVLPVSFESSFIKLKKKIDLFSPEYVLCFGLAKKRKGITIECIAKNIIDARIPDNDGNMPKKEVIDLKQKDLSSNIEVSKLLEDLNDPLFELSEDAGEYVCNYIMYKTINYSQHKKYKATFIHLPATNDITQESNITNELLLEQSIKLIKTLVQT